MVGRKALPNILKAAALMARREPSKEGRTDLRPTIDVVTISVDRCILFLYSVH